MAERTGESMTAPDKIGEHSTAEIRGDIERTRGDMSRTVNEIEERLSPAHIKEQVASVTAGVKTDIEQKVAELKESVIGGYHETKDHLKDDLGRELRGARHMVSDEITQARTAVRDATVGRVEHMVHDARESVTDAGTSVLDTIKENPIPAAMIGIGLGWLLFGGGTRTRRGSAERTMRRYRLDAGPSYGYGYGPGVGYAEGRDEGGSGEGGPRRVLRQGQRAVGKAVHQAGEGASNLGHRVQEGASHLAQGAQGMAHDAGETVSQVARDARVRGERVARGAGRQIMRAERGVENTLRENPLALGAVAIAIGAAIGLSLPHTHVEDEWMGDSKERLLHRAEDFAGEAIHKAEDAVGQLTTGEKGEQQGEQSKQAQQGQQDKDKQDKTPDTAKNGVSNGLSGKSQAV